MKKTKKPSYAPKQKTVHHQQWDIYKQKDKNGILVDGRSGDAKFYRGGRTKDIPLDKLDSWEDKMIEKRLWAQVKARKRFAEPKKKDPDQ